jgi:hypothetical protein
MTVETTSQPTQAVRQSTRTYDLDALSRLDSQSLRDLYAKGKVPSRLAVLEGHPRGRMLAIRALDRGWAGSALRSFAGWTAFPWGGKSFSGTGERGTGVNRVHLFGRHQLFPFLTELRASALDGGQCIVLDYDLPDNPAAIRAIHDEIREIDPGLFLGPAMWKTDRGPTLVLWFALDTRVQAKAIGLPKRAS